MGQHRPAFVMGGLMLPSDFTPDLIEDPSKPKPSDFPPPEPTEIPEPKTPQPPPSAFPAHPELIPVRYLRRTRLNNRQPFHPTRERDGRVK
jgi:hypothetical protein